MKKQSIPISFDYSWRSSSSPIPQKPSRLETSNHKSPNNLKKTTDTFNPLSPDNVEYLVNKRLLDSNNYTSQELMMNANRNTNNYQYQENNVATKHPYQFQEISNQMMNPFSSQDQSNSFVNNPSKPSKAYVNAMKALQSKIKTLEEENKEILKKFEDKDNLKEEEFRNIIKEIKEKEKVFENLERNLKEKLSIIEKERNDYERKMMNNQKELEKIKGEHSNLEKKFEEEFRNYLIEKSEIKTLLKLKEDKLEMVLKENKDLLEEINSLRVGKQNLELNLMSNSDEGQRIIKEFKDKFSNVQQEKEEIINEMKEKELELQKQLEIENNEKNSLTKELVDLRVLSDKREESLVDAKYQINQKENELILLREKVKTLIKEKENDQLFKLIDNNKPKKKEGYKIKEIIEEDDKDQAAENLMDENYKAKLAKYNKIYDNQSQRIVNVDYTNQEENNVKDNKNKKKRLFDNNEEKYNQDYQNYTWKSKQKVSKNDLESIVSSIINLEKELVRNIERYKFLASRLTVMLNNI